MEYRVVVIGGDHYNTYGIVRSLGEKGINPDVIILGAKAKKSFVLRSRYVAGSFACYNHVEAIDYLINRYDRNTENIVICCSDEAEEFIISFYDILKETFVLPVSDDPQVTKKLMSKMAIVNLARECDIRTPKSWQVTARNIPNDIEFPCLTKPSESIIGRKTDIIVCHTMNELKSVIDDPNRCTDFVVQEYIDYETEISILGVVLRNGEVLFSGCIDKLRTCMIGTSSFAVMVDNCILSDIIPKLKCLLQRSGYRGLFSAEFLKKGDDFFFLEVNFRNDGNTYVATTSGLNLPYFYVKSCINEPVINDSSIHFPCYFMLEIEDFRARRKNGVSFSQWKKDFNRSDCCLVFNERDIKPFRKKVFLVIGSRFQIFKIILRKVGIIK